MFFSDTVVTSPTSIVRVQTGSVVDRMTSEAGERAWALGLAVGRRLTSWPSNVRGRAR